MKINQYRILKEVHYVIGYAIAPILWGTVYFDILWPDPWIENPSMFVPGIPV